MPCRPLSLLLPLLAACSTPPGAPEPGRPAAQAQVDTFDAMVLDDALRQDLRDFLEDLRSGRVPGSRLVSGIARDDELLWSSLVRLAAVAEPRVLKSYVLDDGTHWTTLAWQRPLAEGADVLGVLELLAEPSPSGFRFRSPLQERREAMGVHRVGPVEYRATGPFDRGRAERFVRTKATLEGALGLPESRLDYDCFDSLDSLLKAHGLVFDAFRCNDLGRDLGFLSESGDRYATGMGDPCYLFGYVQGLLRRTARDPDDVYGPYLNGVAAYFGGYGPSGDSVETLAGQFREALQRRPDIDFLAEFRMGRSSSIQRHFSHYVMCTFVCRALVERHGLRTALDLVECGADGERFFARLHALLGVDESTFHAFVVEAIEPA